MLNKSSCYFVSTRRRIITHAGDPDLLQQFTAPLLSDKAKNLGGLLYMRKLLGVLALGILATFPAFAQDESTLDVFGGYSYLHASPGNRLPGANTNGWEAQATVNVTEYVGVTADFDGHYGSVAGIGGHDYNFLFGPTLFRRSDYLTPFAHLLFGGSHAGGNGFSGTAFAWAIGGGFDWNIQANVAVRLGQLDYLANHFAGTTQNNFRYSAGVVFLFGS
jgi:hypothetical protein